MKNRRLLVLVGLLTFIFIWGCDQRTDEVQPTACFTASKITAKVDEIIVFDNCSTDAETYGWTFGDGNTSTEISPSHKYLEEGEFTVRLVAKNKTLIDEETIAIVVEASVDPELYDGIESWIVHYSNDFSTDNGDWTVGTNEYYQATISGGTYNIFNFYSESSYLFWTNVATMPLSTKNFDIELKIKNTIDPGNYGSGLIWGVNGDVGWYYFRTSIGYYVLGDTDSGQWFEWENGASTTDYNLLTVRKYDDTYYFFLNKTLVYTRAYSTDFGSKFGIIIDQSGAAAIDFIGIYLVDEGKKTGNIVPTSLSIEERSGCASKKEVSLKRIN